MSGLIFQRHTHTQHLNNSTVDILEIGLRTTRNVQILVEYENMHPVTAVAVFSSSETTDPTTY